MATGMLLAMAVISLGAAMVYVYVGRVLGRRGVHGEAQGAHRAFRLWWIFLAASTIVGTVSIDLLVALGTVSLPVLVVSTYLNVALICVALWGLLYYLVYLYTGRAGAWKPIAAFYVVYYALLMYVILDARPVGVSIGSFGAEIQYATPIEQNPLWWPVLVLLVLPQIVAGLAYFLLYFRLTDRTSKYRVAVVSWSIIAWFGSALVGAGAGFGDQDWWEIVSRLIGLVAALAILAAYVPPPFVRRALGVRGIGEEAA